ncbi:GNAT family N-acetyltransferase [Kineococcus sp. R8]|uniref:GNAT family N-acetyltransferase n=1 Tax=Kineococcus siccus TaxID=2696567 RepID=UPI0014123286|nr:GNAT family N-acetyltransferase [Kineococcus siccus]NAZ80440.1 GNAT family N-acetyltransferase [Kineococcus siccus]
MGTGAQVYASAFVARHALPGRAHLEGPGMHGAAPVEAGSPVRLLITDDRAHDELAVLLPDIRTGMIDVFAAATRCTALVHAHLGWRSKTATAMACRDLRAVPEPDLTGELTLLPVRRLAGDAVEGVPLDDAVAVALSADPRLDEPHAVLAAYLRSLSPAFQLFAAVDVDGAAHATSGVGVFGAEATVIFVNTGPGWRSRGIGRAMTAAALGAARAAGAEQACLNASEAGLTIYQRLGFETVARTTRFSSPT